MIRSLCLLVVLGLSQPALGAHPYDDFRARLTEYENEQSLSPNQLIRFSDRNGDVATRLFDLDLAKQLGGLASNSEEDSRNLQSAMKSLQEVSKNYMRQFKSDHPDYEREYLASFSAFFRTMIDQIAALKTIAAVVEPDSAREALQSLITASLRTAKLVLSTLQDSVTQGMFSEAAKPEALSALQGFEAELQALRATPAQ